MEIIKQFLTEVLMIGLGLLAFIYLVGFKVSCPDCGARFYYRPNRKYCPVCACDLVSNVSDGLEDKTETESYLCYHCGYEMGLKSDYCPDCGCWIGLITDEENQFHENSEKKE